MTVTAPDAHVVSRSRAEPLLAVENLHVTFRTRRGELHAVDGVNFEVPYSSTLGIAGESGSGKSVAVRAVIGLHPPLNSVITGSVRFDGQELIGLPEREWRERRGRDIAMVYQDTMRCLNPTMTVGAQIAEAIRLHKHLNRADAKQKVIELLDQVRIPSAALRYSSYPHQLSGGMRQRVVIAIALACSPKLLMADEPTTGLDVTIQAQILNLLDELKDRLKMSVILVTHDLGVVATRTSRIIVMYAGRIVETGNTRDVFYHHRMPYTKALLESSPKVSNHSHTRLVTIPGRPPNLLSLPDGCAFAPRCSYATDQCHLVRPELEPSTEPGHTFACWNPLPINVEGALA